MRLLLPLLTLASGCGLFAPEGSVWFDGCFALDAAGVCLPGPAPFFDERTPTLQVWVPGAKASALQVEGATFAGQVTPVEVERYLENF